ncbi:hypothetical protein [Pseudomonas solani]|uniref:hypothetical protein n=1 Tax=Pseudomonas solani TaxID=2731552 RepID=UPI003C2BF978
MLKIQALACVTILIAGHAIAEDNPSTLHRQLELMKGNSQDVAAPKQQPKLFSRQARTATGPTGTLTVGKMITYDMFNYLPYNDEPTDYSTTNVVFAGYSPAGPALGAASSELGILKDLLLAKNAKPFSNPFDPAINEICNIAVTTQSPIQGIIIGGVSIPLSLAYTSTSNGGSYTYYAIVPTGYSQAEAEQYHYQQKAFCTTFDSFNSTYPNGSTVSLTLVP